MTRNHGLPNGQGFTRRAATVLIVDDEPQIRLVFSRFLQDVCETLTAGSGAAALEKMSEAVDVVVLDRRMPGLSGDGVLERIRARGYDQPVVMMSAIDPGPDIAREVDEYLVKPVDPDEFLRVIETLVLRKEYDDVMREYFSHASSVSARHREPPREESTETDRFVGSTDRLTELKEHAQTTVEAAIATGNSDELFRTLPEFHHARDCV